LWLIGFTGAHRFYYGRPWTGTLWFFTLGLFGIGWLIDAFLLPGMDSEADYRFVSGNQDYGLAWLLLALGGFLGLHRFYQGKIVTGVLYLFTGGLFLLGVIYDVFSLNGQLDYSNRLFRAGY
jgi:TM2 domain-containing membrane protein YozV